MEKPYAIGIDIGGTNTVFGVVDKRGHIIGKNAIKTSLYPEANDYADYLAKSLDEIINTVGGKQYIKGIGIGAPNGNYFSGCIELPPNLPWKGVIPMAQMLTDRLNLPVSLTNDANAAAIGEMTYGAARGMKDFIVITLGTGVGGGIVANGQLIYGHDGFAGELGHITIHKNGRTCGCGRKGCLETYASATGVARTAREFLTERADTSVLRDLENITSENVYNAAIAGDALAQEVFAYTGQILGEAFANFIAFSSPEAIILFGGLTKAGALIMNPVKESMENNVMNIYKGKTKLLVSELKESDAAILGASALGWEIKEF
ncbi:glucokinase [Dysgonomonas sp. PH5-45]|uniref:ROK family protein n=1 Tax=unclassified Dysgonomonas TaxID=2630389 RepID=UPI00247608D4|nr:MULTISPECIES: ROK family protein [unclassified Dysgonomonas]MDH6354224.1 glucokinase [Dysgonomonas sp. PH5-45]MDH6387125.1 glucokinase [Dysgonomonas sp. PH5-37]